MPKGQVTEEDLASGLKNLSGFGSLGGVQKLRRDSPFRDSLAEPKTVELPAEAPAKPVPPAVMVVAPAEPVSVAPTAVEARAVESIAPPPVPVAEPKPIVAPIRVKMPARPKRIEVEKFDKEQPGQRKADIYEPVTLRISPEMRDQVAGLARRLQRLKTTRGERITANSVMRVAIQTFLHDFDVTPGETANDERELLELALGKVRR